MISFNNHTGNKVLMTNKTKEDVSLAHPLFLFSIYD